LVCGHRINEVTTAALGPLPHISTYRSRNRSPPIELSTGHRGARHVDRTRTTQVTPTRFPPTQGMRGGGRPRRGRDGSGLERLGPIGRRGTGQVGGAGVDGARRRQARRGCGMAGRPRRGSGTAGTLNGLGAAARRRRQQDGPVTGRHDRRTAGCTGQRGRKNGEAARSGWKMRTPVGVD
jgi:hypothetical protein